MLAISLLCVHKWGPIGQSNYWQFCLFREYYYYSACFYYIVGDGIFKGDLRDLCSIFIFFWVQWCTLT